ncbi:10202_t:CDS:2, partial [Rhizophagus irregularis]
IARWLQENQITNHRKSDALFVNAERKLESLEFSFDATWRYSEIRQHFNAGSFLQIKYKTRAMTNAVEDKTVGTKDRKED